MGRYAKYFAAAMVAVLMASSSALAQTSRDLGCSEQQRNDKTLSDNLAQSNGVICPPDIDSGMKAPTPDAGKTPVIPPPGSPGGNPNVQPK